MRGGFIDRGGEKVIEYEDIGVVNGFEELHALRIRVMQHGELVGQRVGAEELGGVILSARCIEQCLGEVGLANGGFAQDDNIFRILAPLVLSKSGDLLFVDVAAGRVNDVFNTSIEVWRS